MTGAWDGVPENPERDGWHLIGAADGFICAAWSAVKQSWALSNAAFGPWIFAECEYLGPVLTPADVEARERAAWQRACEAMREAMFTKGCWHPADDFPSTPEFKP